MPSRTDPMLTGRLRKPEAPAFTSRPLRRLAAVLLVALAARGSCEAGDGDGSKPDLLEEPGVREASDWRDVRITFHAVGSRILHPRSRDRMLGLALAASAFYMQGRKDQWAVQAQGLRSPLRDHVSSAVRPLGEATIPVAVLSTYLLGRMTGSERTRRAGLILSESAAFTFVTTELMQLVLAEDRPADGGEMRLFRGGGHGVSGHTSIVASMAVPLDRMFFRFEDGDSGMRRAGKLLGKTIVYGLPVATGWSRMNDNKHYAWNVVLGLGVGYMMGDFVMSAHEPDAGAASSRRKDWELVPITGDRGGFGLALKWTH